MKNIILILFVVGLQINPVKAQWVNIPDPIFVSWLTQQYPDCMNGNQMDTTCFQVLAASTLDVSLLNLTDLTGVKYFKNLNHLNCPYNQLTTLPELPKKMTSLTCHSNQITHLPELPDSLYSLYAANNLLSSLPLLPSTLRTLDISINNFTTMPILPDSLRHLWCGTNFFTDLPTLPSNLFHLYCDNNQITNLPSIPLSLKVLNCSNNQLSTIPRVRDAMDFFNVSNNNIYCITNIPNSPSGNISNNPLTCVPSQTSFTLGLPLCFDNDNINNPNSCRGVSITGYVFVDTDSNCLYDITDTHLQNTPVRLFDAQNNLLSTCYTLDGVYYFSSLLPDTFKIKIEDSALPLTMDCMQANTQTVVLDSVNHSLFGVNFPVTCDTLNSLMNVNVYTTGRVFPGQYHVLNTVIADNQSWYNLFCNYGLTAGPITIEVDGPVSEITLADSSIIPTVNGNLYTYNIPNLYDVSSVILSLKIVTDTAAQIGDQICVHVNISSISTNNDTLNTPYDYCYQVVNSFDPNMKEVYPVNIAPGYDDWFTYTIHFQNTGNAPAFNIRLRDTLDTHLDISSFEILGYSHPANVTVNGNVLNVRFNNIMLPDSTSDYEGSMGYFQYRLKPLAALPVGTQIENTAYIYFDYNAPVVTNTTQSSYMVLTSLQNNNQVNNEFVLYPNPSNGLFNFKDTKNLKHVEVYNLLGEQILSQGNQKQINLSGFAKGIYYAKINGEVVVKLMKE